MDDAEVVEPEAKDAGAEQAALAAHETLLADQEGQRAVRQREDREASTSTWARRLHEKNAERHDRAEMGHRDAAELHTLQAEKDRAAEVKAEEPTPENAE